MKWSRDDTGLTADSKPYRIVDDKLVGGVGPLAVAVLRNEEETLVRYRADGTHAGGLTYQNLKPPKVRA